MGMRTFRLPFLPEVLSTFGISDQTFDLTDTVEPISDERSDVDNVRRNGSVLTQMIIDWHVVGG